MLTQRLGSDTQKDPAFLQAFIDIVKKNPGSCDEVWLSTDYGFPKLETHIRSAEILGEAAGKLRAAGQRVSLQISNTIGHGQYMAVRDCSGLVYEGSPVENMVGHDGKVAGYCFCWRGENFKKYTLSWIREYARRVQPYCVWVDDDFRASNHFPVSYGCFCDGCMEKFNRLYGANFTREELVNEISFGDVKWRERHIKFLRDGLYELMLAIGKAVHEEAPGAKMGLQYALHGGYTGYDYRYILDAMYEATGIAPATRPGGGSYSDHDMRGFVDKSEFIDAQNRRLPDYVTDRRPEIENLPDIVYGKSIAGTCFETSYYLASGNNAMSYAMLMNDYEPMEWHSKMLHAFSTHRPYWERLAKGSENSAQGGLVYAMPKTGFLAKADEVMGYSKEYYNGAAGLRYLGLSVAMKDEAAPDETRLLTPENARQMTDEEITVLLKAPVITDGKTVRLLKERGFGLPADAQPVDASVLMEYFCPHPVNGNAAGRRWSGQFTKSTEYELLIEDETKAEILSEYIKTAPSNAPAESIVESKNAGVSKYMRTGQCASAILQTPYGAKWAVFAFDFWNRGISFEKRNQYLEAAAYITGRRQPAELITPLQALVQSRVDNGNRLTQVSVTNITVATEENLTIRITRPAGKTALLMGQYQSPTRLDLKKGSTPDEYKVTLPSAAPSAVNTLFFE